MIKPRDRVYWSVFIQWLTHHGILDEYLEAYVNNVGTSYLHSMPSRSLMDKYCVEPHTEEDNATGYFPMNRRFNAESLEVKWVINLHLYVESNMSRATVANRLKPPYQYIRLEKEGHLFYRRTWGVICEKFTNECINGKRPQRLRLKTIVAAIDSSQGEH